jgi:DNA-binding XRE family transcriptional regulator
MDAMTVDAPIVTIIRDRHGRLQHAVIDWRDFQALVRAARSETPASEGEEVGKAAVLRLTRVAEAQFLDLEKAADHADEDADDILAAERGEAARQAEAAIVARASDRLGVEVAVGVPHEVVKRELEGAHPVRAWREFRRHNQAQLAALVGISRSYLAQIETGERAGTLDVMAKIARNLGCLVEDLIPEDVAA